MTLLPSGLILILILIVYTLALIYGLFDDMQTAETIPYRMQSLDMPICRICRLRSGNQFKAAHCPIDHGQAFVSPFHAVRLLPHKGTAVKTAKTLAKQIA